MSTLGDKPNLIDVANATDPNGNIAQFAEILNETNEVLDDMVWKEGNLPTGEQTTIRTGLPSPTWRKLNYGVAATKGRQAKITDTCGMLEDYADCDKSLADLNGNTAAWRLSEDRAHIEGMSQSFANTLFYGDTDLNPERYLGLQERYNDSSAESWENVIDGGGTGSDNISIYLVVWSVNTVFGIYPKGSKAGLSMEDKGQVTLYDANNNKYEGYSTHYKWDCGLCVKDWRYVVHIANIDSSQLTKDASAGADIIDLMQQALELPPNLNAGRAAFYVNRRTRSFLRRQITNKTNVWLNMDEVSGKKVMMFGEVPVRRCDALLATEAQVS